MNATFSTTETQTKPFSYFLPGTVIKAEDGNLWLRGMDSAIRLREYHWGQGDLVISPPAGHAKAGVDLSSKRGVKIGTLSIKQ